MNGKLKDSIVVILSLILSIEAIFLVFGETISNMFVSAETMFMPYSCYLPLPDDTDYFWRIFLSSDHSWFFVSFVSHLFTRILPILTHNHPQDFYIEHCWLIFFSIFCLFCYSVVFNATKYFRHNYYAFIAFWAVFPFIVNNFHTSQFLWSLYNDTWFFCYILNPIFPLFLIQTIEKYYVTSKWIFTENENKSELLHKFKHFFKLTMVIILLFFTGIGHEFFRFIFLGSLIITFILHKIFISKPIKEKQFLAFFFVALLMNCFIFILPNFQNWYGTLVEDAPTITMLSQAFSAFFEIVLLKNINYIILLFIFGVAVFFTTTNKERAKRILISVFSVIISMLIFNYITIFLTDCDLDISQHYGIIFLTKTVFLFSLLSLLGYLLVYCSKKYRNAIIAVVILFLFSWFLFFSSKNYFFIKNSEINSDYSQENQYIVEKFYAMYGKDHNVIYAFYPNRNIQSESIEYLKYWYGGNNKKYKVIFVCKSSDSQEKCRQKMLKKFYKKTKYKLTEKELTELDFSTIKSYQSQKKKGKFFIDWFE